MSRFSTIFYRRLIHRTTIRILPCNRIGTFGRSKSSTIGCRTRHSHWGIIPTGKDIGIFCCRLFRRVGMSWRSPIFQRLMVNLRAIFVLPSNRITILRTIESSFIGCITRYRCNRLIPTGESIGKFGCIFFGRNIMSRHCTILERLTVYLRTILILPDNSIGTFGRRKDCFVGLIAGNLSYRLIPSGEGISIFRRRLFSRRISIIFRHRTILHLLGLQYVTVLIAETDGVETRVTGIVVMFVGINNHLPFIPYTVYIPTEFCLSIVIIRLLHLGCQSPTIICPLIVIGLHQFASAVLFLIK